MAVLMDEGLILYSEYGSCKLESNRGEVYKIDKNAAIGHLDHLGMDKIMCLLDPNDHNQFEALYIYK